MNRERWATVAMAVLFAAATVPAILLRHEAVPSRLASATATPTPTPSRTVTPLPTPAPAKVSCPAGPLAVYPGASLALPDPR